MLTQGHEGSRACPSVAACLLDGHSAWTHWLEPLADAAKAVGWRPLSRELSLRMVLGSHLQTDLCRWPLSFTQRLVVPKGHRLGG